MFVMASLVAILDFKTLFAIETSPLLVYGGQNMHASKHTCTFLCELNNEVITTSVFFHVLAGHFGSHLECPYILCH